MAGLINNFSSSDTSGDRQSFDLWQRKQHETESEAALRKRKSELYALVRKVIRNELDATQQAIVQMRWYEGRDLKYIANILKLDVSTISRKEKTINHIIYDKLKYALEYKYDKAFSDSSKNIISSNRPACCPVTEKGIYERLRNLRIRRDLSVREISRATGIAESRLDGIESDENPISIDEIKALSVFFGVTTDFLIFGNT